MPDLRCSRNLLSALVIGCAAVSLTACDVVINSMDGEFGGGRFKQEKTYAKTFTVNPQGAILEVANTNGKIEVEAVDGNVIDVKATITVKGNSEEAAREALKQVEIREDASPARVRLESKQPRMRNSVEIRYTLRVPRSVKVDVRNTNGAIELSNLQGGVRAETTNGGVKGRGLLGAVEASATNGGLDIQMAGLAADGVRLETTNGGITLGLPGTAKATLSARCVNGGISVTDLAFEKDGENSRRHVEGKINGGGAPLKVETVNGGVRIKLAQGDASGSSKPGGE